ncbi:CELL DIVISION CYCLE PROTEIN 26, Triphosphate Tunnel Metalloenzyme 3 [Hibiscus trionum]|uniref:CELL DIVISION CYCLE PROTEIN 26, Triphosphate Tunnel Metalloenzyme 3 n=1 Tax=Hibiscus trionum TaxID=183268 RepID=A0A9W7MQP5_HIBTR|nr:CELL DIVISION CYCLE PROTEIN 26, Triphosphate Tunnel Metalloenzyme 3 [Hibiscus trionum]
MEVEVKLRLPSPESHQQLSNLLSPFLAGTLIQENIFFDTPTTALAAAKSALRLRFYNLDSHSVLSLKSKPKLSQGISRVEEQEEHIDPSLARSFLTDPNGLLGLENDSQIMQRVKGEFGVNELICLGGFKNVRGVYDWKGLKLELDETVYDFGVSYEIECESREPERDRKLIEDFLKENGIDFKYSDVNKFAVFLSGKLPA